MGKLKPWRFALGWKGWRVLINSGGQGMPYQIVEFGERDLAVRLELLEGGRVGIAGAHRDAARRITLEMTAAEAIALTKGIRDRLNQEGKWPKL